MDGRQILLAAVLLTAGPALGCKAALETGYEPRALGSNSPEIRRGYYAQPFTPEARQARQYQDDFGGGATPSMRPRPGRD